MSVIVEIVDRVLRHRRMGARRKMREKTEAGERQVEVITKVTKFISEMIQEHNIRKREEEAEKRRLHVVPRNAG